MKRRGGSGEGDTQAGKFILKEGGIRKELASLIDRYGGERGRRKAKSGKNVQKFKTYRAACWDEKVPRLWGRKAGSGWVGGSRREASQKPGQVE